MTLSPFLSWLPGDDLIVYGYFAQGFRAGGFNIANPEADGAAYDPETVDTIALGFKSTLADGRVRLNAELFYNEVDDMQWQSIALIDGEPESFTGNFGEATTSGLDLEMTWLISEALTWDFNFGYLDAEIDKALELDTGTGQPVDVSRHMQMARAPEYTLSTILTWEEKRGYMEAVVEKTIADSYTLWNAQAIYSSPDQRWNLAAWVKNIGDERVITDGYVIDPLVLVSYNAPRTSRPPTAAPRLSIGSSRNLGGSLTASSPAPDSPRSRIDWPVWSSASTISARPQCEFHRRLGLLRRRRNGRAIPRQ